MKKRVFVCALFALVMIPAQADWNEGDPYKMHFPQLPDLNGVDVSFRSPGIVADDWLCKASGPVSDIHFWFSARHDWFDIAAPLNQQLFRIHLSIHADIPADPNDPLGFSRPAHPAEWEYNITNFDPANPDPNLNLTIAQWEDSGTLSQDWYDPGIAGGPQFILGDHQNIYQCNITDIQNPFIQERDTVYWLDVSISSVEPLGWKSADTLLYPPPYTGLHYRDDAVWGVENPAGAPAWEPLERPPWFVESLDMAFVITPEPAALLLFVLPLVVRRR